MTFGENLKQVRKKMKLTQQQFAKEINISRSYLSDLENDRKIISIDIAYRMSRNLGISVNELINDDIKIYKK